MQPRSPLQYPQLSSSSPPRFRNPHIQNLTQSDISKLPNVLFYQNKISATRRRLSLNQIHNLKEDYDWLEQTHDYIQWIFPNFYKSQFNSNSYALTKLQASYFRQDQAIGQRMLKSFQVYCNFIGVCFNTSNMKYHLVSAQRAIEALKINKHNHLRIRRILSCLSVTGFRIIALLFLEILEMVINTVQKLKYDQYVQRVLDKDWKVYSNQRIHLIDRIDQEIMSQHNPIIDQYVQMRKQEDQAISKKNSLKIEKEKQKRINGRCEDFLNDQNKREEGRKEQIQEQRKKQNGEKKQATVQTTSQAQQCERQYRQMQVQQQEQESVSIMEVQQFKKQQLKQLKQNEQIEQDSKKEQKHSQEKQSTPPVQTPPVLPAQSSQQQNTDNKQKQQLKSDPTKISQVEKSLQKIDVVDFPNNDNLTQARMTNSKTEKPNPIYKPQNVAGRAQSTINSNNKGITPLKKQIKPNSINKRIFKN